MKVDVLIRQLAGTQFSTQPDLFSSYRTRVSKQLPRSMCHILGARALLALSEGVLRDEGGF